MFCNGVISWANQQLSEHSTPLFSKAMKSKIATNFTKFYFAFKIPVNSSMYFNVTTTKMSLNGEDISLIKNKKCPSEPVNKGVITDKWHTTFALCKLLQQQSVLCSKLSLAWCSNEAHQKRGTFRSTKSHKLLLQNNCVWLDLNTDQMQYMKKEFLLRVTKTTDRVNTIFKLQILWHH